MDTTPTTGSLADRAAIEDLLARYCERLDEYDIPGVAACFAADAEADYGPGRGGPIHGRDALVSRIQTGQAAFRRTHHQLGQIRIALDGDTARSLAYVTAWHERFTGEREIVCLRYRDSLRREAHGWSIARREIEVAFVEGFPGVPWNWVPRAAPRG